MSGGRITLSDGSSWPRPAQERDEEYGISNRLRHAPIENITRSDLLIAASIIDAYGHLVGMTQRRRNSVCGEIQRSIEAEEPHV